MWPWGHLAVGYLAYVAVARASAALDRSRAALLAVGIGTQFPDLVDKPLAWTFGVLPSGRSLAHSLITATILVAALDRVADRFDRRALAAAFGVGYLSHLVSDLGPRVWVGLLSGDASGLRWTTYLLWPVLDPPPYPRDESFAQHFADLEFPPDPSVELLFVAAATLVWVASGESEPGGVRSRIAALLAALR